MKSRILFSIFIDIPPGDLDNPGWYDADGVLQTVNKSSDTKEALLKYYPHIKDSHIKYADDIGVEYKLHGYDDQYAEFLNKFKVSYPMVSVYDIINFYKHHLMLYYADLYDEVCYIDFDVIPNTTESIFDSFDLDKFFGCAESNEEAGWGKNVDPKYYNTCIRNPSSKYWNCHAMLDECGYEPDTDVFNTGIMIASSSQIKNLAYFNKFDETLDLMSVVKNDSDSMYPMNIQRVFNYDNETVFAYMRIINGVDIHYLDDDWHHRVTNDIIRNRKAKMHHVINKKFSRFFK
jgi:hypothetical protein